MTQTTVTDLLGPPEYHKIQGPFKRFTDGPNKNKVDWDNWSRPEFDGLLLAKWDFSEKLDGTNIRVHWDGHRPSFFGRTDRADLHKDLLTHLEYTFPEELFEQHFGEKVVTLYGEGVGPGIQKNGRRYGPEKHFVLFDVKVGQWWLQQGDITGVAQGFGISRAPVVDELNLWSAIQKVGDGYESAYGGGFAEGLVGVPSAGYLDRRGSRIIIKLKHVDLYDGDQ